MPENATPFEPSETQESILKLAQDGAYARDIRDLCCEQGIERSTYYRWFDHPDFCEWWQNEADRWFALQRPRVLAAIADSATAERTKGSPKDRELFLQRFDKGFMPKTRQEVSCQVGVSLNYESMSDDELQRIARASGCPGGEEGAAGPVGTGTAPPA